MKNPTQEPDALVPTHPELTLAASSAPQTLAVKAPPSVGEMLAAIVQGGITPESVGALKELAALKERMDDKQAERDFNAAFTQLQQELPVIVASSTIPNRGKYEKYEHIMQRIGPLLTKHGFSVSYDMDPQENRVNVTCHLRHIGGHATKNSFAVRVGRADTETQADCKAATTAKRNALIQALSLVITQDALIDNEDVGNEGAPLSADRVQTLKEQLREVGGNEAAFLAVAGVDSWDKITDGSYGVLFRMIQAKRKK